MKHLKFIGLALLASAGTVAHAQQVSYDVGAWTVFRAVQKHDEDRPTVYCYAVNRGNRSVMAETDGIYVGVGKEIDTVELFNEGSERIASIIREKDRGAVRLPENSEAFGALLKSKRIHVATLKNGQRESEMDVEVDGLEATRQRLRSGCPNSDATNSMVGSYKLTQLRVSDEDPEKKVPIDKPPGFFRITHHDGEYFISIKGDYGWLSEEKMEAASAYRLNDLPLPDITGLMIDKILFFRIPPGRPESFIYRGDTVVNKTGFYVEGIIGSPTSSLLEKLE